MNGPDNVKQGKLSPEQWAWTALGGVALLVLLGAAGGAPAHLYWGRTVPAGLALLLAGLTGYLVVTGRDDYGVTLSAALLVLFSACIFLALPNGFLSIVGDNVRFIGGAVGLSQGKGYIDVWRDPPLYQVSYGVGMPLLLLPSIWLFPDNVIALKVPIALTGIAGVALTYLLYRRYRGIPAWLALVVAALVAVNGFLVDSMDQVMTEIPYYAATVFALLAVIAYARRERLWDPWLWGAGAGIAWCYYVRANGASVLIAAAMAMALKRQWKKLGALTAVTVVLMAPWQVRNSVIKGKLDAQGLSYPSQFSQFLEYFKGTRGDESGYATKGKSVEHNVRYILGKGLNDQWRWSTELLFRRSGTGWKVTGLAVMLIGLLVHMYRSWFRHREELAVDFYVGGAVLLNLLLGAVVATRYVLVLAPFLLFYFLYGCVFLWEQVERRSELKHRSLVGRLLVLAIAASMFYPQLTNAMRTVQFKRQQRGYGGAWGVFHDVVQWVGKNTTSDTKLVTRKPQMVYPWIKRHAECYPFTTDADSMLTFLRAHDYTVLDAGMGFTSTQKYVVPVVNKYIGTYFRVVHRSRPMYYGKRPFYQYVLETIRSAKDGPDE